MCEARHSNAKAWRTVTRIALTAGHAHETIEITITRASHCATPLDSGTNRIGTFNITRLNAQLSAILIED